MLKGALVLGAAALAVSAQSASAATVSINFVGGGASLLTTDTAGNPNITGGFVSNWNNATGATNNASSLVDSNGATTAVAANWTTTLGTWSLPTPGSPGTNLSGGANPAMMSGYLDADQGGATVNISGLSSFAPQGYKIAIYFDGDNGGDWRVGTYTVKNTGDNSVLFTGAGEDSEGVDFNSGGGNNANGLFQIPVAGAGGNQPYPTSPNNSEGNFLISGDLTADSISLNAVATAWGGTPRAPINGIQIIAVPEPTSLALFGIAGIGLLARRRR